MNRHADVAFICAMPMELEPLVRKLDLLPDAVGDMTVHVGTLGARRVAAIVTGMGTDLARSAVTALLDACDVGRAVVVGITGAVEADTPIGTVVRPEVVIDGATGADYRPAPLGPAESAGAVWTTDTVITQPDVLADLAAKGVVALDMETAAVASVCQQRGVDWSVVRVVSDRAGDGSIDEEVFALSHQDGTPDFEAVERYLTAHPDRLEALGRLAEGAQLATELAADTAIEVCAYLP